MTASCLILEIPEFQNSKTPKKPMSNGPILFEEIFEVTAVNPDGKTFEKGSLIDVL